MASAIALPETAHTSTALDVEFREISRTFTSKAETRTVLSDVNLQVTGIAGAQVTCSPIPKTTVALTA